MLARLGETLSPRKLHKKVKDVYQQQTAPSPKQRPVIGSPTNFQHNSLVATSAPSSPFAAGAASPLSPRRKRAPPVPTVPRGTSSMNLAVTLTTDNERTSTNTKATTNAAAHTASAPLLRTRLQNQVWLEVAGNAAAASDTRAAEQTWKQYNATLQPDKNTITFVGIDEATMTRTAMISNATTLEIGGGDMYTGHEFVLTLQGCTNSGSCFCIAFEDDHALMLWTAEVEHILSSSVTTTDAALSSSSHAGASGIAGTPRVQADDDVPLSQHEAARKAEEDEFEALWENHLSPPQLPPKPAAQEEAFSPSPPPPPVPPKRCGDAVAAAVAEEGDEALPLPAPPADSPKASACIFDLLDRSPSCDLLPSLSNADDGGEGVAVLPEVPKETQAAKEPQREQGQGRGGNHDRDHEPRGEPEIESRAESVYAVSTKVLKGKAAAASKESRDLPLAEMADSDVRDECQQLRLALQLSRGKAATLEVRVNELTLKLAAQAAIIATHARPGAVVKRTSFSAKLLTPAPPLPLRDGKAKKITRKL